MPIPALQIAFCCRRRYILFLALELNTPLNSEIKRAEGKTLNFEKQLQNKAYKDMKGTIEIKIEGRTVYCANLLALSHRGNHSLKQEIYLAVYEYFLKKNKGRSEDTIVQSVDFLGNGASKETINRYRRQQREKRNDARLKN